MFRFQYFEHTKSTWPIECLHHKSQMMVFGRIEWKPTYSHSDLNNNEWLNFGSLWYLKKIRQCWVSITVLAMPPFVDSVRAVLTRCFSLWHQWLIMWVISKSWTKLQSIRRAVSCFVIPKKNSGSNAAHQVCAHIRVIPFEISHSHPGDHLQISWKFSGLLEYLSEILHDTYRYVNRQCTKFFIKLEMVTQKSFAGLAQMDHFRSFCGLCVAQFDVKGRNFLHIAIQKGDLEAVLFLLSVCVNVNSRLRDSTQMTPLHLAVISGHEMIVRNLVCLFVLPLSGCFQLEIENMLV